MRMPNRRSPRAPAWLSAALLVLGTDSPGQESDADWIDQERLLAGEIVFDFGDTRRFEGFIRAAVLIAAEPERIWQVLRDCESAPEYVPHVRQCELVETRDEGRTEIFRQEVKYTWFLPRFEHLFSLQYTPYDRIDVARVSGPIERMEGIWRLRPTSDGRTLLTYDLELLPGLPVPRFMIGATLRRDIPTILAEVRRRAEAAAIAGRR